MTIAFYGAAGTVTGSKHLITLENGKRILLDCGLFQGRGAAGKNDHFLFDPSSVDYLVLSHAHIDHCGLIPSLVKKGFHGKIFATPPSIELTELLLRDTARIQYFDSVEGHLPGIKDTVLFNDDDVSHALELFVPVKYNEHFAVDDDIELFFTDAGHILGSAVTNLSIREHGRTRTIAFTGDLGRYCNRILNAPQPFPQAEVIISESTYGNKLHRSIEKTEERLLKITREVCVKNQGRLLIPAFSVGRTQELVFSLNKLAESGRLPDIPVFVDSPLSVYATEIIRNNMEYFNRGMKDYIRTDPDPFGFPKLVYITDQNQSSMITSVPRPYVVISSSGMMEAGRILQHLKYNVADEKNGILLTGFASQETLGGKIGRGDRKVSIEEDEYKVNAKVYKLMEYSAHADYEDILRFLSCQDKAKVKNIFLVHGERRGLVALQRHLHQQGFAHVEIAAPRIHYAI